MKPRDGVILLLTLALMAGAAGWVSQRAKTLSKGQTASYARSFERGQSGAARTGGVRQEEGQASPYADARESAIQKFEGNRYRTY